MSGYQALGKWVGRHWHPLVDDSVLSLQVTAESHFSAPRISRVTCADKWQSAAAWVPETGWFPFAMGFSQDVVTVVMVADRVGSGPRGYW